MKEKDADCGPEHRPLIYSCWQPRSQRVWLITHPMASSSSTGRCPVHLLPSPRPRPDHQHRLSSTRFPLQPIHRHTRGKARPWSARSTSSPRRMGVIFRSTTTRPQSFRLSSPTPYHPCPIQRTPHLQNELATTPTRHPNTYLNSSLPSPVGHRKTPYSP